MSAIWGCVDLGGEALSADLGEKMRRPLAAYTIDRFACRTIPNAVMGCGIQYITRQAANEPLPLWDDDEGLLFTADCFIDNRRELLDQLCPGDEDIPDGALLFAAYKQWRGDACRHVRGTYSFALYDSRGNTLTLAADHTLSRSLYYRRVGSRVFFSTLIEPILRGAGEAPVDETWLATYLGLTGVVLLENPVDTAFEGVKRALPASTLRFTAEDSRSATYWSPKAVRPLRLASDEDYRARFRGIFESAAREVVRTDGEVGISLSSGLDSASVAAFVAPELARQGKQLHSYTWVPVEGHKNNNPRHYCANERAGVELLCSLYPNIAPTFTSVPELDAITPVARELRIHETPYKALGNLPWVEAFEGLAARDGCRVMLNGQFGNNTISNGRVDLYPSEMIARGHFIRGIRDICLYGKRMGISRKKLVVELLLGFVPVGLRRLTVRDYLADSYLDPERARQLGIGRRDRRLAGNSRMHPPGTLKNTKDLIVYPILLAQTSDATTRLSLKHGTLSRDITRDIRFIEFCLGAPLACFTRGVGHTRRMVREYLDDKLPPEFLADLRPMGVQSGDLMDRLAPKWDAVRAEMARVFSGPQLAHYADMARVQRDFERLAAPPTLSDWGVVNSLGAVYVLGVFLEQQHDRGAL